ncbi:fish-egg lectin-like [Ambystoma mexicanum]|uniref:fish-egg lectin-like n=1 Tax=Ambystoma mexicanum TaxID=8296 RepID=UPI0037E941DC
MAVLQICAFALMVITGGPILVSGQVVALSCSQVPGALVQIDAGNGLVFGVDSTNKIYTLFGSSLIQLSGALIHVSVGAAGVWGVNGANYIYKMVGGNWVQTSGSLKQIDAGGAQFVAGVNSNNNVYCLNEGATVSAKDGSPLPWVNIPGALKYYSCGPLGCWGVNSNDDVFFRNSVTPNNCQGNNWQLIVGKLSMIEVGRDGTVYGVNSIGHLYRRNGILNATPMGTSWTQLTFQSRKFRHVSIDLGLLWLITSDQKIFKCPV